MKPEYHYYHRRELGQHLQANADHRVAEAAKADKHFFKYLGVTFIIICLICFLFF